MRCGMILKNGNGSRLCYRTKPLLFGISYSQSRITITKKDYKACLEWLDKAIILDSHDIDIYLIKSDVFIETNQIDGAQEILEQALQMVDTDEHDVIYAQLSDIFEMKEDFESAYDALSKALTLNPKVKMRCKNCAYCRDDR